MKTLILMRHAKTEDFNAGGDKTRELTERGRREGADVGTDLEDLEIDLILCSTSTRTRQTVEQLALDSPVEFVEAIYNASVDDLVDAIAEVDDDVETLLVVGHVPSIPALAETLAGDAADDAQLHWFPTAAFATLTLDGSWAELADVEISFRGVQRRSQQ